MSHEIQDIKETAEIVYLLNDGVYELSSLNKEIWKKKKKKKKVKNYGTVVGYVTFLNAFCESCKNTGREEVRSQNINLFASWLKLNKLNKRSHILRM